MVTWDDTYRAALKRSVEAKWRMDDLQAQLEKAEDEHHLAHAALDDLEGASPTAEDVRDILSPGQSPP